MKPENKTPPIRLNQLRKKAKVSILRAWSHVESTARDVLGRDIRPSLPKDDLQTLREIMQQCLHPKGGELTARGHAVELGIIYKNLNATGKERFLRLLADEFGVNHAQLASLVAGYPKLSQPADLWRWEQQLRQTLTTPRSLILRQFTALPDGFKFLVDMRKDVLDYVKKNNDINGLDRDLKEVLSSWFDIGLLDLVEIRWEKTPAALLEKLIAYEAVHEIRSWDDLKNRLDRDRKIYAFFHSKMPLEPLIFVQVAFVKGLGGSIQELLDTSLPTLLPQEADTALFYSISNAQAGLSGISFGNFLIKRVVAELSAQHKHIKSFATLSPIPGFRRWLDPLLAAGDESLLEGAERTQVIELAGKKHDNSALALAALLARDWQQDTLLAEGLKPVMMRLCAHYLLEEKKHGKPLDPVANFHLFNGARLERLNWMADISAKGMKQSAGMMVNYYYKLSEIDENHEEFAAGGKIVASRHVRGYV